MQVCLNTTVVSKKKNKSPLNRENPNLKKIPRDNYPQSYLDNYPVWRFGEIDLEGPFGWLNIESIKKTGEIIEKLKEFESMTWKEITNIRKNNHFVEIENFSNLAKNRLREIERDDCDEFFSLRLTGLNRIWGRIEFGIFYILWWDPNHEVCPSHKKHT